MYTSGFGVALILGVLALLAPALWLAWWLVADLGEKVSGRSAMAPQQPRQVPRRVPARPA